ncbi:MAG: hypothetical protein ACREEB_14445, partial [Caulobacteraceae bacterium]
MNASDYMAQDATGLAALIAARKVSAHEVMQAALARLEAVNPRLNAVTMNLGQAALEQVKD